MQSSTPQKGCPRKGNRDVANEGPCSVIFGAEEKYFDKSSFGGGGSSNASQKLCVMVRKVLLRVDDDIVGSCVWTRYVGVEEPCCRVQQWACAQPPPLRETCRAFVYLYVSGRRRAVGAVGWGAPS